MDQVIWNYVKMSKTCESAFYVSEFGRTRNDTLDNNSMTTWATENYRCPAS